MSTDRTCDVIIQWNWCIPRHYSALNQEGFHTRHSERRCELRATREVARSFASDRVTVISRRANRVASEELSIRQARRLFGFLILTMFCG